MGENYGSIPISFSMRVSTRLARILFVFIAHFVGNFFSLDEGVNIVLFWDTPCATPYGNAQRLNQPLQLHPLTLYYPFIS
jgi:hypothetical protein